MNTLKLTVTESTIDNVVKEVNAFRLSNKNKWYQLFIEAPKGATLKIKAFNTWAQIAKFETLDQSLDASNCMDQTPTQFKMYLKNILQNLTK
mgnify:CR=1 FL=1